MFCDLVGSVTLSERLEAEDLRELLTSYQRRATSIIKAAGGLVARYQGDGILAYFGYPVANEDDAERAVRAGLELIKCIGELGPGPALRLYLGLFYNGDIHTSPPLVLVVRLVSVCLVMGVELTRAVTASSDGGWWYVRP
jgi:class 3 adenylate cyclase